MCFATRTTRKYMKTNMLQDGLSGIRLLGFGPRRENRRLAMIWKESVFI